ncbi:MAG: peptidoglycan DD-metalloendopeptidase family protein [Erysipelotrichaceae bacterium]
MHKWQKGLLGAGAVVLSLVLAFSSMEQPASFAFTNEAFVGESIIEQKLLDVSTEQREVYEVYLKEQRLGVIQDRAKLDALLVKVYQERYEETFPNTKLWFGEDIFVKEVLTYQNYEDKDEEILTYLDQNDMFSIETNKVEFSNGSIAYVKDIDDFREARDLYVLNYISKEAWTMLTNKQKIPELSTYGTREISFEVVESATVTKGLAPASKILKNRDECLSYLSYGYDAKPVYYTVQDFDTIEGIAWLQDLTVEHVMSINSDKIISQNQVLEPGMELNVQQPDSPITVVVEKEVLKQEKVTPPPTQYVYDANIREGVRNTIQNEKYGKKNVKYKETYVNGELVKGEKMSELVTEAAQPEIISIGTKVVPNLGSGRFRWPVDNPRVTCGWYCYANHTAIDVVNLYSRYGNVYASDRGTVIINSWHPINGYWMEINHNNGFVTYYGHLNRPGYAPVGSTVTQGEVIGQIGQTGVATGPHVHFEIRYNGSRKNPCNYLGC